MNYKNLQLAPWQYEISNQICNLIGEILTPNWDSRLLGLSNLPIKTILDIGANNGQFAKKISKIFPSATIYAFEPVPLAFDKLKKWADKQDERVKVFQLALGDENRELEMNVHKLFSASSSFLSTTELLESKYPITQNQEQIIVSQKKLDEVPIANGENLRADILIKLDVQGYEEKVIKGGREIFRQAKGCIVEVSLDMLYEGQATFKDIFSLLSNLGYEYKGNIDQVSDRDGHIIFFNAVFIK
ncbi:MAG: FkbM family methyltransferase [Prochloraceae cyanobacterium]|nr:FkbM family methyltransferase [Prochloraceae cyanobacterium]